MKMKQILGIFTGCLAAANVANADITGVSLDPASGGVYDITNAFQVNVWKDFTPSIGLGPIELTITVDSAGVYRVDEGADGFGRIKNSSGLTWTDFHWELVAPDGFRISGTSGWGWTRSSRTDTTHDLWGAVKPSGSWFGESLEIYAPSAGTFTLVEYATVPEPSTLTLAALGAGLLLMLRRR
jgi:hypothetical protein